MLNLELNDVNYIFRSIPVHFAAISGQKSPAIRHFSGAYPFNHADFQLSYVL